MVNILNQNTPSRINKRREDKKERKHELNKLLKNKLPGGTWDKMVTVLGTRGALACTASFTILRSCTKRYSPDGFLTGKIGVFTGQIRAENQSASFN
jgi:hypothetical protein